MNFLDLPSEIQEEVQKYLSLLDLFHLRLAGVSSAQDVINKYAGHAEIVSNLITLSFCHQEVMQDDSNASPITFCLPNDFIVFWFIGRAYDLGDIYIKIVTRSKQETFTRSTWDVITKRWAYLKIPPDMTLVYSLHLNKVYDIDHIEDYEDLQPLLKLKQDDTYITMRDNLRRFLYRLPVIGFEKTGEHIKRCQIGNLARLYEAYFSS